LSVYSQLQGLRTRAQQEPVAIVHRNISIQPYMK